MTSWTTCRFDDRWSIGYIDGHSSPNWVKSPKQNLVEIKCHGGFAACGPLLPPIIRCNERAYLHRMDPAGSSALRAILRADVVVADVVHGSQRPMTRYLHASNSKVDWSLRKQFSRHCRALQCGSCIAIQRQASDQRSFPGSRR